MRDVEILWSDYVQYWLQTASTQRLREEGRRVRAPKLTPERWQLFADTVAGCKEREVDPRLWLFCLFRARRWTYPPRRRPEDLMSEGFLSRGRYQEMLRKGTLDGYRRHKTGFKRRLDPNKDLIPGAEQKKRGYIRNGATELCMLMIPAETYGYHPKSRWCQRCPSQAQCRPRTQRLVPFDILALRRGEITPEEARAACR